MTVSRGMVLRGLITLLLIGLLYGLYIAMSAKLWDPAFVTGWVLLAAMVLLTLLNVRKKLPFLPIVKMRHWMTVHVYLGWFAIGAFLVHLGFRIPTGAMEITMAILFAIVAVSGVVGLFISRSFAQRLTRRGEEVIFERIPVFRRQLREAADDLASYSVERTQSTSIANFYADRLRDWFAVPSDYFEHIFELNTRIYQLDQAFDSMQRYLNDGEKEVLAELRSLVHKKYELDYHYALQRTLKAWLFVHIPVTYALLVFAAVHVVLVHSFTGAAS